MHRQVERIERAHGRYEQLFFAHLTRRQELECQTIASILADPARGRELVVPTGLKCFHFEDDSYRLMYAAVLVAADRGKETVLRLIYKALLAEKLITEMKPDPMDEVNVRRWSIKLFVHFACSFPSSSEAPTYAKRLMDCIDRQEEVKRLWTRMIDLLSYSQEVKEYVHVAPIQIKRK